jgi:2-methylfumaryl-CoA isomerase
MNRLLHGLRVVEGSAFVAAPSAGLSLAQLGAEVIRFDPIGGGLDYKRWPVNGAGVSLYWAGLNKGKRSVALALDKPEGRELALRLIAAPGEGAGLFLTNFPARDWLDYGALRQRRADLVMVNVTGNADGTSELDYTVNAATGLPFVTGAAADTAPVNHVLPAWDLLCGQCAVTALLAAERHRRLTGAGQYLRVALSDVAFWSMGNLGFIAEAEVGGGPRQATGNDLFGAFGRDFETADGRRVMLVAITGRQWQALVAATGVAEAVTAIERHRGLDLREEGDRYLATAELAEAVAPWCRARTLIEVEAAFKGTGVCWGPYRSIAQMLSEDARVSTANPMFERVHQPGIGATLTPGSPIASSALSRQPVKPAPRLGQHTDEVLADVLGLDSGAIAALHDKGIVAGPAAGA